MKKIYSMFATALCAVALNAQVPVPQSYSGYDGTSFIANWSPVEGNARLSVFSISPDDTDSYYQDFSAVIKNGSVDADAAAALQPAWTVSVSENGSKDATVVNGKETLLLDAAGDAVTVLCNDGFINKFNIAATVTDAVGIDQSNSPVLTFDFLLNDGSRMGITARIPISVFIDYPEYDFGPNLTMYSGTLSGVKVSLEKAADQTGSIAISSIECGFRTRQYLLEKEPVADGSHLVEGCDPEVAYYFCLLPVDADTESDIMIVDEFLAPQLLDAELISSTAYCANWTNAYKADQCVVSNYLVNTFADEGDVFVYHDDFDKADKGTLELPEYVSSLDPYTELSGWETATAAARIVNGMIGTARSTRPWPPMGGYLYSPALDLSANGGVYTIATRVYGTPGDVISIYRDGSMKPDYTLNIHQITINDEGYAEDRWEMTDGVAGKAIDFESKGMNEFFIDYLYISQRYPAGYVQYVPVEEITVDAINGTYDFTDLQENATYAYRVKSLGKDYQGQDRESPYSDYQMVDLSLSSVNSVEVAAKPVITVSEGAVSVTVDCSCTIALYTTEGVRFAVAATDGPATLTFPVPSATHVIVTAGGTVAKVLVP